VKFIVEALLTTGEKRYLKSGINLAPEQWTTVQSEAFRFLSHNDAFAMAEQARISPLNTSSDFNVREVPK